MRPRVRQIGASLLDAVDGPRLRRPRRLRGAAPGARHRGAAGRPGRRRRPLRAWSQAIVRMYEPRVADHVASGRASRRARSSPTTCEHWSRSAGGTPADRPARATCCARRTARRADRRRGGRRPPSCCSTRVMRRRSTCSATGWWPARPAEGCGWSRGARSLHGRRRGDAPVRLGAAAVRAHGDRRRPGGGRRGRAGGEGRGAARFRQPRSCGLRGCRPASTPAGTRTRTWRSARACTSAWALRWPGWSWRRRSRAARRHVSLADAGGLPRRRPTFVLRGYASVPVTGRACEHEPWPRSSTLST